MDLTQTDTHTDTTQKRKKKKVCFFENEYRTVSIHERTSIILMSIRSNKRGYGF